MAQVITEGTETERAKAQARSLSRGHNRPLTDGVYPMQQAEFYVYLYTVGHRENKVSHALLADIEIPACKPGETYRQFGIPIPEPFPQRVEDVFNVGRDPYDYHRGNAGAKRIAQDVCQPSNPTLNQDMDEYGKIDPFFAVQTGTNLSKYGVFWSLSNPPLESEIKRAEKKRDNFYRYVINQYDRFAQEDPKAMERLMGNAGFDTRDVRIALEFFGEERPGFKKYRPTMDCPNCGKSIAQGLAYHRDEDGDLCILDWRRAVAAGKKTLEQVPVDCRWDGFELPKRGPGRPAGSANTAE